jgi:ketosteroid isomerase-like protein
MIAATICMAINQTNTELVQRLYQMVQAGDVPSLLNLLAEDVLWEVPEIANVPFAGIWRGRQQVGEFFSRMAQAQDVVAFEPEEFTAQGDTVVVLGRFTMHVKATDKLSRAAWAHIWRVEGGKITFMREYVDTFAVSRAYMPGQPD